jgi:2,4-dienoyl-CoA reductase-like NADH-dependent reductase (Old Yellow Enzyme family)
MTSPLFDPIRLRGLSLENRIMVSPMCQYSAVDGSMTDWHFAHLGMLANSGAALLCFEMTDVEPIGRITPGCSGLYSDANEAALRPIVAFCRAQGQAKLAIQLAHAGRKASTAAPWDARISLRPEEGGWQPVAPSAIPMGEGELVPRALTRTEIQLLVAKFADSTRRAERIGFDAIELHSAHGYLMHEFLSPLSNRRNDEYGGPLANRMRFPLEVLAAVRAAWPESKPLGVRISCTDWIEGGWDIEQSVVFARELKKLGCDWIDCSSGGLVKNQVISVGPGYQVPFAERIRKDAGIATIAIGLITEAGQAEKIVAEGKADMVALARGFLWDPRWGWHSAVELGAAPRIPSQYLRARPAARADVSGPSANGSRSASSTLPATTR